jgi:hypothetical protein
MAITLYKEHLVVSSPIFHPDEQQWIASIIINWKTGKQQLFHDIKGLPNRFDDRQAAEIFGMEAARAWIDKRL